MFSHFINFTQYRTKCNVLANECYEILIDIKAQVFLEVSTLEQISQIQAAAVGFEGNLSIEHQPKNC